MPDQHDIVEIAARHLVDDVLNVGLLVGRNALLVGKAGQRHRMAAVTGRAQLRHDTVPRPRSEPRPRNEYEFRHGGNLAQQYVGFVANCLDLRSNREISTSRLFTSRLRV